MFWSLSVGIIKQIVLKQINEEKKFKIKKNSWKIFNRHKGSGGNEKLPSHRIPTVGIVWKSPSTPPHQSHKHHHHGGAVCPSYGVVSMDTPDRTRVTYSKGVGREHLGGVLYKSTKYSVVYQFFTPPLSGIGKYQPKLPSVSEFHCGITVGIF